jgi:hypothetical protein
MFGLCVVVEKNCLNYRLFFDCAMLVAGVFGLVFRIDGSIVEKYRGYKIDLFLVFGEFVVCWLFVLVVYVIGCDGVVKFVYVDSDYKVRFAPTEILATTRTTL